LTVPVGVVGVPARSATVATQLAPVPKVVGFGAHTTPVAVGCVAATVTVVVSELGLKLLGEGK
jgi:hypothetical protein